MHACEADSVAIRKVASTHQLYKDFIGYHRIQIMQVIRWFTAAMTFKMAAASDFLST